MVFANPYTYTGRRLDAETGLYQYRNRYYHAQLGRFVSRDPIGYKGSRWSLYEYVGSRATNRLDPFGLAEWILDELGQPIVSLTVQEERDLDIFLTVPENELNRFTALEDGQRQFYPVEPDSATLLLQGAGILLPWARKPGNLSRVSCPQRKVARGPVFEGLTDEQIDNVRRALKEAGLENSDVLIKGADMPDGYFGMTLGDEGFVINRAIIDDAAELGDTLRHELQHVFDRRILGDPNAIGQAMEDAARAAERGGLNGPAN